MTPEPPHSRQTSSAGATLTVLSPAQAWQAVERQQAILVDVRTWEEQVFVGVVPKSIHVPWALGPAMLPNPNFLHELSALAPRTSHLIFLCRAGHLSAAAAQVAHRAGWNQVSYVQGGFEGPLDEHQHRGTLSGWRLAGTPWTQS